VAIGPNHALGYHQDESGFHLAREGGVDSSAIVGNAGLTMTVRDLMRWEQNLAEPRVGSRAILAQMETPVALPDGGTSPYGLGLEVGQDRGMKKVAHGGGDPGVAAYVIRYPEAGVAVAVLCNLDNLGFGVGALTRRVAALVLPDVKQQEPGVVASSAPRTVALTPEELESKAGLYRDPSSDTFGRVYVRDGKLMASADAGDGPGDSIELTPIGGGRFIIVNTPMAVEFVPGSAGRSQEVHVTGAGPQPMISQRVDTGFIPTGTELRAFAGSYASPDLDTTYTVVATDAGLVIQVPGRAAISLQPVFPDAFYGSLVDLVRFSRDARTRVTGFTINRTSVRNLRFERVR
jgi:hypothetical protein